MIYYTGDIHGDIHILTGFIQQHQLTEQDVIVVLGDAGLNYYGNDSGDKKRKYQLNRHGVTIFCIHGNHEMRPQTIPSYQEREWRGGTVYAECDFPNILFAKDGEIYDLDGCKSIVIGGAYSVDKFYRLMRGAAWFPDEQPSPETKNQVETVLDKINWQVDQVLSHTCPTKYTPTEMFLPQVDQSTVDHSTEEWLDTIEDRLTYRRWFCGHWHVNKHIDKMHFLFHNFEI